MNIWVLVEQRTVPFAQIKADIYGKPFVVAKLADGSEGGHGLGLFALTSYGIGLHKDIGICVSDLLPNRQVFEPSMKNHNLYQELFGVYRSLSRKLMDDFSRLDMIMRKDIE
jgi:sugar (pentulose or hexulose) kinase